MLTAETDLYTSELIYNLNNRRYIGSKYKLINWIQYIIKEYCKGTSFCDIFAGTGVITNAMLYNTALKYLTINDMLYSNNIIYKAFFEQTSYNINKILKFKQKVNQLSIKENNYISKHFGSKFFSMNDAKKIGWIRQKIEDIKEELTYKEYCILLASLIYSADKSANTVGHFDAYIKKEHIQDTFKYELIKPINTDKQIKIHQQDANLLAQCTPWDIVYIDPPYNSRQYSRFYHILENIAKWEKPTLYGVAMKPKPENMSEYSRCNATLVFNNLIQNLKCKYMVVSYNNTYTSKSNSSKNKIEYSSIIDILKNKGKLQVFNKQHQFFSTGKTEFDDHKEYLFVVKVR